MDATNVFERLVPENAERELLQITRDGEDFGSLLERYGEIPPFAGAGLVYISDRIILLLLRHGFPEVVGGDLLTYRAFRDIKVENHGDLEGIVRMVKISLIIGMDIVGRKNSDGETFVSIAERQGSDAKILALMSCGVKVESAERLSSLCVPYDTLLIEIDYENYMASKDDSGLVDHRANHPPLNPPSFIGDDRMP